MTYDSIIKEIEKILSLSKKSTDLTKVCYFDVDKRFEKEFSDLIDLENTWYEIKENALELKNNIILLKFEARKTHKYDLANELEILLDRVSNKPCNLLKVIMGYIICKEDENKFIELTKKLHIGPYKPIKDLNENEKIKLRYEVKKSKLQFERINNKLKVKENESLNSSIKVNNKEILFLQSAGYLKPGALLYLKDNIDSNSFNSILDDLYTFSAISSIEYNKLKHTRSNYINYSGTLEELVQYYQSLQDVNILDIMKLKPLFGDYLVTELMFELVKKNIFTNEEFNEYLNCKDNKSLC